MGASDADARIALIAEGQNGLVATRDLRACGLTAGAVRWRVDKRRLHRVHQGVYAVGYVDDSLEATLMAAVLAGGDDAWLSGWATLALDGLVRWDGRDVDVTVRGGGGREREGIRFHRRRLAQRDTTKRKGIRTVTVAWAIVECADEFDDTGLTRLVRRAQMERRANVRQLADVVDRTNGSGARRVAAIIAPGPAPTASGHEDVVLDLILDAGFEPPDINVPMRVGDKRYVPDLRWPAQRLILEVDSGWHDHPVLTEDDAVRQAALESIGERVLRTTRKLALDDPRQLFRRLELAGAPRRR